MRKKLKFQLPWFDFFRKVFYFGEIGFVIYDLLEIFGNNITFQATCRCRAGFSIFNFLTGNFDIIFCRKPIIVGKCPVVEKTALQCHVVLQVVCWPKISKRSFVPVPSYLTEIKYPFKKIEHIFVLLMIEMMWFDDYLRG